MPAPQVYVRTHSISLPGSEASDGAALVWCACYDGGLAGTGTATAYYRIFLVDGFDGAGIPEAPEMVTDIDADAITIPKEKTGPWNRDEAGYGWPQTTTIIPNLDSEEHELPAGLYAVLVSDDEEIWDDTAHVSWAYFLVRRRTAYTKALVCYPFSTLAAYSGGSPVGQTGGSAEKHLSLYNSIGPQRARRVALDRPLKFYAQGNKEDVCIQFAFFFQEFTRGYKNGENDTVDVCTSFDLHSDANVLDGVTLFVSVGHDEYWTEEMRAKVEAFVAGGKNAAFFSGNALWWKIRFEDVDETYGPRTIACYKNAIEDPLTGDDEKLTAQFSATPAAGVAGGHASREENALTGVSYRRGILGYGGASGYEVWKDDDPYFASTSLSKGNEFGGNIGLFELETDGADFVEEEVEEEVEAVLTGKDGTPNELVILATLDLRTTTAAAQVGIATRGYYTNVGTVFTAGTTHWAKFLLGGGANAQIVQITKNVLDDLYDEHERDPCTFPSRAYPSRSWTELETIDEVVAAVTSRVQGVLLMQGEEDLLARDAESPLDDADPPTFTGFAESPVSLASDIWGDTIIAGRVDGAIEGRRYYQSGVYYEWDRPGGVSGVPVGLAGHSAPFAIMKDGAVTTLFKIFGDEAWRELGRIYPPIRAMTGFDSLLFGVRDGGANTTDPLDLYVREASNVDLVWTKIGTAPPGTYALAAYHGRLYALAPGPNDSTKLYWRLAVADDGLAFRWPSLLFLDGADFAIGRLSSNGHFVTTGEGELDFSYTHVTRANDGLVFFYDQSDGSGVVVRFAADGTYTKVKEHAASTFGTWHLLAYVRCGDRDWSDLSPVGEKVLFYNNSGDGSIGYFDAGGDYHEETAPTGWTTNWTHIVCTHAGRLFFYKSSTGDAAWGKVDDDGVFTGENSGTVASGIDQIVPAGHEYLLFYDNVSVSEPTKNAWLNLLRSTLTNVNVDPSGFNIGAGRLLAAAPNGVVLDYAGSEAKIYGFAADGAATKDDYADYANVHGTRLNYYPTGFASGWSKIVGIGILLDAPTPAALPLTGWWRAPFAGSTWPGTPSAGDSATRSLSENSNPPAAGASVNGFAPADFDGTDDILASGGNISDLVSDTAGSIAVLVYVDTAFTDTGSGAYYDAPAFLGDNAADGSFAFCFTTSGARLGSYNGVGWDSVAVAASTGAWHLLQARWSSTTLEVRVDSGSWSTLSRTISMGTHAMVIGQNYTGTQFLDGKVLELLTASTRLSDADFEMIRAYANDRYALAL